MAEITRESNRIGSLLSKTNRVEAPFVRVEIGGYTFGVYEGKTKSIKKSNGVVSSANEKYPNFIQRLQINKINGTVNQYTLDIKYPITENSDPNFFEKLFSSVSNTRKISITYGDFMLPEYIYRDEEAIITNITSRVDIKQSVINYTIEAVSTSKLTLSGTYIFPAVTAKPSDIIKKVLYNPKYHLTEVFLGMRDKDLVESSGFISSDDKIINIPTCTNMSILEYISVLVSHMVPAGSSHSEFIKSNVYSLTTYEDTSGKYGGAYFKVQKIQKASSALSQLCTYDIDIGYPTANIVTSFDIKNNKNWSIFYNYNKDLENSEYRQRINSKGDIEYIYSPQVTSNKFNVGEEDSVWWTKATQFPIEVTLTLKGLLKPAVLMQYVKLNVWFYGKKHISSGYYIIKSQTDTVSGSGYITTLSLLRIAPDEELI